MGDRFDSGKLLPAVFNEYLRFPYKAAVIWSVLLLVGLAVSTQFSSAVSGGSGSTDNSSIVVEATDPCAFSATVSNSTVIISSSSFSGAVVSKGEDGSLIFRDPSGSTVASLRIVSTEEGEKVELLNAAGELQYVTKPDDDGYKILSPERELIARVKFKEEKFNIYGPSGERIYYGKAKKGSILIRNDAGSDLSWISASNSPPLTQIAPLCLPLDEPTRALLYAQELVKNGVL